MTTPQISVIIPVYNTEKYLRQCLDSVINQTLKDIEVICVNDGSTDDSLDILKEYEHKDLRIKVVDQKHQNAGVSRNNGLTYAMGKYIQFVDSDDWIDLNMLESLYNRAEDTNADIVLFLRRYYYDDLKLLKNNDCFDTKFLKELKVFSYRDIPKNIFGISLSNVLNKFYNKSFIINNKLKFQNLHTCNDVYFSYSSIVLANKLHMFNDWFYNYRRGISTQITAYRGQYFDCIFKACDELEQLLVSRGFFPLLEKSFYITMKKHMSYEYSQMNDTKCKKKFLEKIKALYYEKYFKNFFNGSNLDLELCNMFPKISVIVPVYNTEKYLHKCLDSVINQTFKDIEIICVNDGSTDSSYKILKDYAKKDNRIKIINQKNKGLSEARNKALDMVSSPYVMFIDSDDWIESITLEIFYDKILKENVDIVLCNFVSIPEDQLMLARANKFQKYYDSFRKPTGLYKFNDNFSEYRVSSNCKLYKMDIINKYNLRFPVALINEDESWHWYYFSVIKNVYFINESFYHRLIRKDSLMSRRDIDGVGVLDMIYNLKYIYQYLQKNKIYSKYDKQYIKYFDNCTRNVLLRSSSNRKLYKKANREIRKLSKELKFNYFLYANKHYYKETLNYFFSVYNENTHKVVKIFGLKIKFHKEKILKTRKNITKVFERIFCIKNEGVHKVVGILSIKIKVKRKYKILLETLKYQEKCIKNLQSQVELQNKLVIKALLKQTDDFNNILTEKIGVVDEKITNQSEGFKKVLTEKIGVVDEKITNQS
ncbi:MAG: glycosyltransferase, partial [Endomicrobium sp.]|nr:glycosyltransferase [Endomicrobium sp.]